MNSPRRTTPSGELATEASGLLAGFGIITAALFPIALPGLLLFVVAPLILVAAVGLLLAIPIVVPLWLARTVMKGFRSWRSWSDWTSGRAEPAPWQ